MLFLRSVHYAIQTRLSEMRKNVAIAVGDSATVLCARNQRADFYGEVTLVLKCCVVSELRR